MWGKSFGGIIIITTMGFLKISFIVLLLVSLILFYYLLVDAIRETGIFSSWFIKEFDKLFKALSVANAPAAAIHILCIYISDRGGWGRVRCRCRWLLRSTWISQEILSTFDNYAGEVALIPCRLGAGAFIIRVG